MAPPPDVLECDQEGDDDIVIISEEEGTLYMYVHITKNGRLKDTYTYTMGDLYYISRFYNEIEIIMENINCICDLYISLIFCYS